jgi:hypothetical protein
MAMSNFQKDEYWKDAILEVIKTCGQDSISLQQIYSIMKNHPLVTEYHLEPWREGGQPRYQCWIREYLTFLIREKKICRISRGIYTLRGK